MPSRLLLVTGLPGTGKTTLGRQLAQRYRVALLGKDTIKEPLLDALGAGDAAHSRQLSDMAFATLFALARECVAAGADVILEGNFRKGEHEAAVRALGSRTAQILCTLDEFTRRMRLAARQQDPTRHPGHRDAQRIDQGVAGDCLLDLPGECIVIDGAEGGSVERIDRWWTEALA